MFEPLKGKIALVTGGTRGIGNGIAKSLAESGVYVVIVGTNRELLKQETNSMVTNGLKVTSIHVDFEKPNASELLVSELKLRSLVPDILINGLGGGFGAKTDGTIDSYERVMKLNFFTAVELSNTFLPTMIQNGWGRIIFIGTLAINHKSAEAPYVAAKSALISYMKILAKYAASKNDNVIVNAVSPGAINVPGKYLHKIESDNPELLVEFLEKNGVAAKRLGKIHEVANVVKFLCSNEASYLHGSNIEIDGGASN